MFVSSDRAERQEFTKQDPNGLILINIKKYTVHSHFDKVVYNIW